MSKACLYCGGSLPPKHRSNQVYCSVHCQRMHVKAKWREMNPKSPLGAQATGTVAEASAMRVCIDLLARGYSVYRAAFPAMPFDILVYENSRIDLGWETRRVKVTTGSLTPKGTPVHPVKKERMEDFDVLAIVLPNGEIRYVPEDL